MSLLNMFKYYKMFVEKSMINCFLSYRLSNKKDFSIINSEMFYHYCCHHWHLVIIIIFSTTPLMNLVFLLGFILSIAYLYI